LPPGTDIKTSKKTAEPLDELGCCLGAVADGELYFVTSTRMFSYSPGGTKISLWKHGAEMWMEREVDR
jgi:hypothetical protein